VGSVTKAAFSWSLTISGVVLSGSANGSNGSVFVGAGWAKGSKGALNVLIEGSC
jgi:hypothetical protein